MKHVFLAITLVTSMAMAEDLSHPEAGTGPGKGGMHKQPFAPVETPKGTLHDLVRPETYYHPDPNLVDVRPYPKEDTPYRPETENNGID